MHTIPTKRSGVKKGSHGKGGAPQRPRGKGCKGKGCRPRQHQREHEWQKVVAKHAPADLDQTAREQGAISRERGLTEASVLLRLALAYALESRSLADVAAWAELIGIAVLSAVGLRKRLQRSNKWLAYLVAQEMLRWQPKTDSFPKLTVVIQDASFLSIPGSKGASHRVHLVLDLAGQRTARVQVTDIKGGEKLGRFELPKGCLVLGDRIYGTRYSVAAVTQAGS